MLDDPVKFINIHFQDIKFHSVLHKYGCNIYTKLRISVGGGGDQIDLMVSHFNNCDVLT